MSKGLMNTVNDLLKKLVAECRPLTAQGELASYIPELLNSNKNDLGVHVTDISGNEYCAGDWEKRFSIQSVSKPLIFICAMMDSSLERVMKKVSFEPTNDGFNSIVNLETKNSHKPLNPFINSGAILCIPFIGGETFYAKYLRVLEFFRRATGSESIGFNERVYLSEKTTGSRNRALAYFMKSTGLLECEVEEVLDAYFRICSIEITARELSIFAALLANDGVSAKTGERHISERYAKTVKAIMTLCGMYDESGAFAVSVGMPSKSGVGGGIMSVSPGKLGVGVYGPSLNEKGSSIAGIELLKRFSEDCKTGVF